MLKRLEFEQVLGLDNLEDEGGLSENCLRGRRVMTQVTGGWKKRTVLPRQAWLWGKARSRTVARGLHGSFYAVILIAIVCM